MSIAIERTWPAMSLSAMRGFARRGRGGAAGGLQRDAEHVTAAPRLLELGRQLPRRQAEIPDRIRELGLRWTAAADVLPDVAHKHPRAAGREVCVVHDARVALELDPCAAPQRRPASRVAAHEDRVPELADMDLNARRLPAPRPRREAHRRRSAPRRHRAARPPTRRRHCWWRARHRRTGSGGNTSVWTASATPPPIRTSSSRTSGVEDSVATRIADTAASVTSSSPPPRMTAASIASTTSNPIWGSPAPITRTSRSASTIPSITPAISCTARCLRSPNAAPSEITAAIDANAGRCSTPNNTAQYHAPTAATARLQDRP